MCGIAAILSLDNSPVAVADLERMCAAQRHRGPDSAGFALLAGGRMGLASVRLSIMDLAGGDQPLFSEDDSLAAICNGEIYDYREQRRDLEQRGHTLRTHSDSELLVHWYEESGLDFIPKLNGEFAFVLWDERGERLIAARDRAGVKPLFYAEHGRRLLMASEIRGLFAAGLPRQLSPEYFTGTALGVMDDRSTPFTGVRCLRPGHLLIAKRDGTTAEQPYHWWSFAPDERMGFEEARQRVRAAATKAVQRRLVADVSVQCYLSGGLDSAIVCGLMAESASRFRAYHVSFPGSSYDESQRAAAIARHFGQSLQTVACTPQSLAENLAPTVCHVEAPLSNCNAIGKFLLSKLVRGSGDKVCLTGEGADEAFGGYAYFKLEALWRSLLAREVDSQQGGRLLKQFEQLESRSFGVLWHRTGAWKRPEQPYGYPSYLHLRARQAGAIVPWLFCDSPRRDALERRLLAAFPPMDYGRLHPFNATRKMAFQILAGGIIPPLGDRVEMAHSVECRTPFLDPELLELAATIPPAHFIDLPALREKHVLWAAFRDLLPAEAQRDHKHPFLAPPWRLILATATGRQLLGDYLSPASLRRVGLCRPWFARALKQLWQRGPATWKVVRRLDPLIGILLTTHILHAEVIEREPALAPLQLVDRTPAIALPE